MHVYLINRADRPQRLLHALAQLRKIGMSKCVTRIEACTPHDAQGKRFSRFDEQTVDNIKNGGERTDLIPTWGAAACALSHYRCWERVRDDQRPDTQPALIVEDDIEITSASSFLFRMKKALCALELCAEKTSRSPHVWLFNASPGPGTSPNTWLEQHTYRINDIFTGLHCYLVTCSAAKLLLRYCSIFTYQVDIQIGQLVKEMQYDDEKINVINSINAGITQSTQFETDTQPMTPSPAWLSRLFCEKCPIEVIQHIGSYLPKSKNPHPESLWFVQYLAGYSYLSY